jgi:dolichol-phosphate mannosyltransferase
MKKLVVIPTYKESENIDKLIKKIWKLPINKVDILVIDDSPDDKTKQKIKLLQQEEPNLNLIDRSSKLGLSSAYIRGFQWGLKRDYDLFIQMDGDLSHSPEYLSDMIKSARNNNVVVGSRYAGGDVKNWDKFRNFISWAGNSYARMILGMNIRDMTSGFCLWNKDVLESLSLEKIYSDGYSFQVEMKYRATKNNFSISETPIVFKGREEGQSKMSKKIFFEAVWMMWWLKLNV